MRNQPAGVKSIPWDQIATPRRRRCAALWERVWPTDGAPDIDARLARIDASQLPSEGAIAHMLEVDGDVVAIARTFRHTVTLDGTPFAIVALASVCSDPDHRGRGYGDAVVAAAFAEVDRAGRPALFQTGVPEFYERFGSRKITNVITTSAPGAAAFTDDFVMIHPGDTTWDDDAVIDIGRAGW